MSLCGVVEMRLERDALDLPMCRLGCHYSGAPVPRELLCLMSNPTCFIEDICSLKIGDMECLDIVKSEEGLEPPDENQKVEKLKESHLLLKKKLSLSHELIKQFNDKTKECQEVSTELATAKATLKHLTQKNISSVTKIMQLECENEERRKKIDDFLKTISERDTKIAADQQHLQQLICKIEVLERKEITTGKTIRKEELLREKVRILETELKAAKDSHKSELKQMEIKLKSFKTPDAVKNQTKKKEVKVSHDKSTCTGTELRPETTEKCTMTNEFYSIKDDPYPLFCSKCLIKLDPVPLDQILSQMSACPTLITEVPSPTKKSGISKSRRELSRIEVAANDLGDSTTSFDPVGRIPGVSKSDFQRLEQKLSLLERKLRKKTKKEDQSRNPCCGFQYPNNCYLGPHPSMFQPRSMIQSQADLFQFQNWQEGLRGKKRSRKISLQKTNRRGMNSRKKRRLEDGTSEWSVDPVQSKGFIDSVRSNISDNESEPLIEHLRVGAPPSKLSKSNNKPAKQRTEFSPSPKRRKQDKLNTLFSPAHSSSHAEEELDNGTQNLSLDNEEMIENGNKTPEPEVVECIPKKRGRPPKNQVKTSTKKSLVKKIRNLKKNSNKTKPLPVKTVPVINDTRQMSNPILGAKVVMTRLDNDTCNVQTTKNDQILNNAVDYCPVKKHRIAHSARQIEDSSIYKGNKSTDELPGADFRNDTDDDDKTSNKRNETVPSIEKSDKIESILDTENPKSPVVEIAEDIADTNVSQLIKSSEIQDVEKITNETVTEDVENDRLQESYFAVHKALDEEEKVIPPLQPCIIIPRMYLETAGVENPCDETNDDDSVMNLSSNNEKISSEVRILRSQSKTMKSSSKELLRTEVINPVEDVIAKCSTLGNSEAMSLATKDRVFRPPNYTPVPEYSDNELSESVSDINDTSMSVKSDKTDELNTDGEKAVRRKYNKRSKIEKAAPDSPMRELRSRRIMLSRLDNIETKNPPKNENEERNKESLQLLGRIDTRSTKVSSPRALLDEYFMNQSNAQKKNSFRYKKVNTKLQQRKEDIVLKELSKLADDELWSKIVLTDTIERLLKFKIHTIAKCTIDFLVSRADKDEELDRSHTPPAPLLSKTQQRILAMLVTLNRTIPNMIRLVQSGIEFRLFRLGHAPEQNIIQELTRVFTALARIQKDRERVRILCCDAIYCLNLRAMPLIYVILTSWPEVVPMAGSSSDPLIRCLINSIMTQPGDPQYPKFFALKKLLTGYYNYETDGISADTLTTNLMSCLREKRENGLDTSLILLAKKKGPDWADKNIIKGGLLQMIIHKAHPSIYDAFCLLGYIMRSFPIDDKNGSVKDIIEQLCALMESGEGSVQQQEGVATAMISLYRHSPQVIGKMILTWNPVEPLSKSISQRLNILFNIHMPIWWKKFLCNNSIK